MGVFHPRFRGKKNLILRKGGGGGKGRERVSLVASEAREALEMGHQYKTPTGANLRIPAQEA